MSQCFEFLFGSTWKCLESWSCYTLNSWRKFFFRWQFVVVSDNRGPCNPYWCRMQGFKTKSNQVFKLYRCEVHFRNNLSSLLDNYFLLTSNTISFPIFPSLALEINELKGFLPARSRKAVELKMIPRRRCQYECKISCKLMSSKEKGESSTSIECVHLWSCELYYFQKYVAQILRVKSIDSRLKR